MGLETEPLLARDDNDEQDHFEEWLCREFKGNVPNHLTRIRNRALKLIFPEILSCVLQFGFYDIKDRKIVLFWCILNTIVVFNGISSKL